LLGDTLGRAGETAALERRIHRTWLDRAADIVAPLTGGLRRLGS
jgi:hypothetical protein